MERFLITAVFLVLAVNEKTFHEIRENSRQGLTAYLGAKPYFRPVLTCRSKTQDTRLTVNVDKTSDLSFLAGPQGPGHRSPGSDTEVLDVDPSSYFLDPSSLIPGLYLEGN